MTRSRTAAFLLGLVLCLMTAIVSVRAEAAQTATPTAATPQEKNEKKVTIKILFVLEASAEAKLNEEVDGITKLITKSKAQLNTLLLQSKLSDEICFTYCDTHASFDAKIDNSVYEGQDDIPGAIISHTLKQYKAAQETNATRTDADLVVIFVNRHPNKKEATKKTTLGGAYCPYNFATYERPLTGNLKETEQDLRNRQKAVENAGYTCCVGIDIKDMEVCKILSHEVGHLLGAGHPRKPHEEPGPQANMEAAGTAYSVMSYKGAANVFSNEGINNNWEAVKNFAHVVSLFREDGGEHILNSSLEKALRMPFPHTLKEVYEAYGLTPDILGKYALELTADEAAGESDNNTFISWIVGTNYVKQPTEDKSAPRVKGGAGKAAWYKYTARTDGTCRVLVRKTNTKEGFSPVLAVFKNTDKGMQEAPYLNSEQELPPGILAEKQLHLRAGEEVYIAVDCVGEPAKYFFLMVKQTMTERTNTRSICTYGALGVGVLFGILFFLTGNKKQDADERSERKPRRSPLPTLSTPAKRTYSHLHIKGKWDSNEQAIFEKRIPIEELSKEGGYSIGRSVEANDLRFPHRSVSARHLTLSYGQDESGPYISITDLDTKYGTVVNGVQLQAHETARLGRSADVKIGSGIFIFRLE